jgi:hypothetical protein
MAALEVSELLAQSERSWERCRSDSVHTGNQTLRDIRNVDLGTCRPRWRMEESLNISSILKTARGYAR